MKNKVIIVGIVVFTAVTIFLATRLDSSAFYLGESSIEKQRTEKEVTAKTDFLTFCELVADYYRLTQKSEYPPVTLGLGQLVTEDLWNRYFENRKNREADKQRLSHLESQIAAMIPERKAVVRIRPTTYPSDNDLLVIKSPSPVSPHSSDAKITVIRFENQSVKEISEMLDKYTVRFEQ